MANEDIDADIVLVIDENGVNLGQMKKEDAIKAAEAVELDLVCVAPKAAVPVCRFMDFKKYLYEIGRRAKDSRKNQKIVVVKEIRISPVIGEKDFETNENAIQYCNYLTTSDINKNCIFR